MGGRMSKEKGKEGEREVRNLFRQLYEGFMDDVEDIRRNHQQAEIGGHDLVGVPHFSVESKRVKVLPKGKELDAWWSQTVQQATACGKIPCLVMRQDRGKWMVMIDVHLVLGENGEGEERAEKRPLPTTAVLRWRDFERYVRAWLATL